MIVVDTTITNQLQSHAMSTSALSTLAPAMTVPERVLRASEALFAEFGFQGCSLRKIAKAAGTSESGVLRFFDSKEDVFLGVLTNALAWFHEKCEASLTALPASCDATERLLTIVQVVFDLYETEPDKVALIFSEGGLSIRMLTGSQGQTLMTLPGMTKLVDMITALFAAGRKEGTFPNIDPVAAREVYFGIIEGCILGWLLARDPGAQYKSASAKKLLVVVRRMLNGLRVG